MIFGHRNVRRMLDSLSSTFTTERMRELEGQLAWNKNQARAAEWEIIIGYALAQVGTLVDFGVDRAGNPDFIWSPEHQSIIVEVTCISDISLHDHNQIDEFAHRLRQVTKKQNLNGVLNFNLGSSDVNGTVTLAIPAKQNMDEFFRNPKFHGFIQAIKEIPDQSHVFIFEERGASSTISYVPGLGNFSGASYRSFTNPQTYCHSPVVNALRGKEDQIRKSGLQEPALLFICDNGCDALKQSPSHNGQLGMKDIVGLFLNGQQRRTAGNIVWQEGVPAKGHRIHAVIWIAVEETWDVLTGSTLRLKADMEYATYAAPYLKTPEFINSLNSALAYLPVPLTTPRNASNQRKFPRFYGGYSMTDHTLKFSALTLQKLLAGEISHEEFSRDHPELVARLKYFTQHGMALDEAMLEQCENQDDDWIFFRFGGISPDKLFKKNKP
jgi:hypothetical protein